LVVLRCFGWLLAIGATWSEGLDWVVWGSLGLVSRGVKKGLRFWTVVRVLVCFEGSEGSKWAIWCISGFGGSVLYNIGCVV